MVPSLGKKPNQIFGCRMKARPNFCLLGKSPNPIFACWVKARTRFLRVGKKPEPIFFEQGEAKSTGAFYPTRKNRAA